ARRTSAGEADERGPIQRREEVATNVPIRRARCPTELEVRRDDQIGVERANEELGFLAHVRVRHATEIAKQGTGCAIELVVEHLDGGLLEDSLAPGLALGTAEHDSPVAEAFLGPVERIDELSR